MWRSSRASRAREWIADVTVLDPFTCGFERDSFSGLRVLILGLGRFGGGSGAARFFAQRDAEVTVTDQRPRDQLLDSVTQLDDVEIAHWRLGEHRDEDLEQGHSRQVTASLAGFISQRDVASLGPKAHEGLQG